MSKFIRRVASALLGLIVLCSATQAISNNLCDSLIYVPQREGLTTKSVMMDISLQSKKVKAAEAVNLKIRIKNTSTQILNRAYDRYLAPYEWFSVVIRDAKGESLKPTKNLQPNNGIGSVVYAEYGPGKTSCETLRLTDYFDLPIGSYTVTASVEFFHYQAKKKESVKVVSSTIFIVVK